MSDRARQALHLLGLEPIAETTADPNSYGFRPHRCVADAIEQCFTLLSRKVAPVWILECDIKGCFDNINHDWILEHIPMDRKVLSSWLKAGFIERATLMPTRSGVPQGGIASPTIANMVLDGMERMLREAFPKNSSKRVKNQVHIVRYADDFVVTGNSKEVLEEVARPLIEEFLRERGLELSAEKTRVTHIDAGFDFLGHNIRKYNGKLLIKPSKASQKSLRDKVRTLLSKMKTAPQSVVIQRLSPVLRGWARFYSAVVCQEVYDTMHPSTRRGFGSSCGSGVDAAIRRRSSIGSPIATLFAKG